MTTTRRPRSAQATKTIGVRLDAQRRQRWGRLARQYKLTKAAWLRLLIDEEYERAFPKKEKETP